MPGYWINGILLYNQYVWYTKKTATDDGQGFLSRITLNLRFWLGCLV
jgi:hypothetical protein